MTEQDQGPKSFVLWGGAAGFLLGGLISTVGLWPEVFQRLRFSLSGSGGESSDWGEPLFYIVIFGVPWGMVGALLTMAVLYAISSFGTSKKNDSPK